MPQLIAAIDQGTTSTRCIIFDATATPRASAQRAHQQITPRPGWVEHDPAEIYQRTCGVIAEALAAAGASAHDLAAVGITNQRETTLVWDRHTGRPLANAIVWQDTRTAELCAALAHAHSADPARGQDRFRAHTGLPLATYFSGPKLRWLLDHTPGLRAAAERGDAFFGTLDSYLVWRLTGGPDGGIHVTDVTNASRTMLMDLATLEWDDGLLAAFDIPRAMLPAIVPSSRRTPVGLTRADGPFGGAVGICAILGDQQAALVGQTCLAPGDCKNTYGTGCFLLMNTGPTRVASQHGLLTTVAYQFAHDAAPVTHYALEGSVAVGGALIQWLRDNLGVLATAAESETLAATVPDSGGVIIVPAFSGLFAPWWRADARGLIIGLTRHTTRAHLARAALDATCFQTCDVLAAMNADAWAVGAVGDVAALKVDGGMTGNALLLQLQADLLGVPVVRPVITETTALGVAFAAGLAAGVWRDAAAVRATWREAARFAPAITADERARRRATWRRAVERSMGWLADGAGAEPS